jgi:hypothetical protein
VERVQHVRLDDVRIVLPVSGADARDQESGELEPARSVRDRALCDIAPEALADHVA